MKHFKKLKFLVVLFAVIGCIAFIPAMVCKADFGNYAGDTDYGGGTTYDYGGNDTYDTYDYGGGNDITYSSDSSDMDPETAIAIVVIVAVCFLLSKVWGLRKNKRNPFKRNNYQAPPRQTQTQNKPKSNNNKPMSEYTKLDPNFDATALSEKMGNLYVQMQQCWTAKNIEPLRPYFTDALFNQMNMAVQQNIRNGHTNYVDRIAVLGVTPTGWYQANGFDHIKVTIETRIVDYTLDDRTGKLISGNQKAEKFMTYEWDISRKSGVTTSKKSGTHIVVCPNCGANVDINASAICEYCKTPITAEQHDWVITNIKGISQRTAK